MPSSPRVIRVVVGLLLGGVLGVVLAGSTGFQWNNNGIRLAATLGDSYCCNPNVPACLPTTGDAVCGGGIFPTLGSCQTSCVKTIFCCDMLQGAGQVCRQGFKNLNGSTCQNPAVSFDAMQDCTNACPANGTGVVLSSSSSSADDIPYCGCATGAVSCVPAIAS